MAFEQGRQSMTWLDYNARPTERLDGDPRIQRTETGSNVLEAIRREGVTLEVITDAQVETNEARRMAIIHSIIERSEREV